MSDMPRHFLRIPEQQLRAEMSEIISRYWATRHIDLDRRMIRLALENVRRSRA